MKKPLNIYISVGIKYTYECQLSHSPFKDILQKTLPNPEGFGKIKETSWSV